MLEIHVALSLIGIASGLLVLYGLLVGRSLGAWTAIFLVTTILTSLTGFPLTPFGFDAARAIGVISLVLLAAAVVALRGFYTDFRPQGDRPSATRIIANAAWCITAKLDYQWQRWVRKRTTQFEHNTSAHPATPDIRADIVDGSEAPTTDISLARRSSVKGLVAGTAAAAPSFADEPVLAPAAPGATPKTIR
jgi:hypothetical protein